MKKNLLFYALTFATASSLVYAQPDANPAPTPNAATPPTHQPGVQPMAPGRPGMPPRGFPGRPFMTFRRASMGLMQARMELQRSTNDFAGHRQSAIDACDKAIKELDAVMQSTGGPGMMSRPRPMAPQPPVELSAPPQQPQPPPPAQQ